LAGSAGTAQPPDCSPQRPAGFPATGEPEVRKLEEHLRAGPFYKELRREFGKPLSCGLEFGDQRVGLTYAFRGSVQLSAEIDRGVESSEERVEIPRMEMTKAIALLKAAEKYAYGRSGCGIMWDHPEEESSDGPPGSREAVYRGEDCNCQARVTSRNHYALSLVLKSAC
jgi:hypothetical protein